MNSAIERLLTLRVCDIMNSPVVVVASHLTMADAARLIAENNVSGLPVVDRDGRCVGVLSTADFADREMRLSACQEPDASGMVMVQTPGGDSFPLDAVAADRVEEHMSPIVQTIDADSPIMNASRLMCREHIHRLVIVDDEQRPVGLISSLDLVAATVAAVEE